MKFPLLDSVQLLLRGAPVFLLCSLATGIGLVAADEKAADPYAKDPYWYKPGHPVDPAAATAIKTAPGFVAERIFTVPRELGSWTALCVDPQGRLIAAAQQQAGLFRITPSPIGSTEEARLEKMGGVAATIGWSQGLLYAFDSLYVTVAEENGSLDRGVYRLQDTDGDGVFDKTTQVFKLDGSGEHGPHNLVVAPDGKSLVLMCGNKTRVPESVRQPGRSADPAPDHLMPPGFESSHFATQGWAMRFEPDGKNAEVILSGLRNSYDLAFDRAGELFTFDSDAEWDQGTPWYRPTRICHLLPRAEFGWRDDAAVWPSYYEDSVPAVQNIGPGSPSGLVFGYGAAFPAKYQRALFVCDWTFATIHAVFLEPNGASYRATTQEFVGGAGLPLTDVVIGKDGAMYFIVGGRRLGSAVYRVRYTGSESTAPIPDKVALTPLQARRQEVERLQNRVDDSAVGSIWADLGSTDRALRFAARIVLEDQPVEHWRQRALSEHTLRTQLTALLALARKGTVEDQASVLSALSKTSWGTLSPDDKLTVLRTHELTLARGGEALARDKTRWGVVLRAAFPDPDVRVTRELSRLRCALGDTTITDRLLDLMAADTGEHRALGTSYFERNPKYGQAVREMLESAPLVERMHHAQMLLWLADQWTAQQRREYFRLMGDAVASSKGGHSYTEFWTRIRDTALLHVPPAEREELAKQSASAAFVPASESVAPPKGPGRNWTIPAVNDLAAQGLHARDYADGKSMFSAAGCVACHRLGGEGGTIGPDLTGVGQRFTPADIIEAIIEPSRAISDQYRMVMLQTKDDRSYSGRILSRDDQFTRIATNLMRPSQTIAVPNASITSEQSLPVSLMPSGLIDPLNENELLDLLAYLVSGADANHAVFRKNL